MTPSPKTMALVAEMGSEPLIVCAEVERLCTGDLRCECGAVGGERKFTLHAHGQFVCVIIAHCELHALVDINVPGAILREVN